MPPQSKAIRSAKSGASGQPVSVKYVDSTTITTPTGARIHNYKSAEYTYLPSSKGSNKKK